MKRKRMKLGDVMRYTTSFVSSLIAMNSEIYLKLWTNMQSLMGMIR